MRLINTSTLVQQEFFDSRLPPYAVLSHTWDDGEVNLQQYLRHLSAKDIWQESIWAYHRTDIWARQATYQIRNVPRPTAFGLNKSRTGVCRS